MTELLEQVHLTFNLHPECFLRVYPPFWYFLWLDDLASIMVAGMHINYLVYVALRSFAKPLHLCVSDLFAWFKLVWSVVPSIEAA